MAVQDVVEAATKAGSNEEEVLVAIGAVADHLVLSKVANDELLFLLEKLRRRLESRALPLTSPYHLCNLHVGFFFGGNMKIQISALAIALELTACAKRPDAILPADIPMQA